MKFPLPWASGRSSLQLGQVVGGPAVAGLESLGLSRLGVPHDPEPVTAWFEGDYPVVPDPELLPPSGGVDMLGGEANHADVGLNRLFLLQGHAREGAGPIVKALCLGMLLQAEGLRCSLRMTVYVLVLW